MDRSDRNANPTEIRRYPRVSPALISIIEDLWAVIRAGFLFLLNKPIYSLQRLRMKISASPGFVRHQFHKFKLFLENFIYENPISSFFLGWAIVVFSLKLEWYGGTPVVLLLTIAAIGVYFIYKPVNYWLTEYDPRGERAEQTEEQTTPNTEDSFGPRSRYISVPIDNPPRYESLPNLHPELFKSHSPPRYDDVADELEMPPRYSIIFSANDPDLCAIHQNRASQGCGGSEPLRTRSLGDLPSISRPLDHT